MAMSGAKKAQRLASIAANNPPVNISVARRRAHFQRKQVRRQYARQAAARSRMPLFPEISTAGPKAGRRFNLNLGAMRGKKTAAIVAAGALGVNAVMSNSGRATDRTVGRPTGMFKY